MRSLVILSSVPAIRSLVSSIGNKLGVLAAGTRSRCSVTTTPIKHLQNVRSYPFSHSTRPQQQQRHRLTLRPAENKTRHGRNSGHHVRHHYQQQIPPYVYFMGGIPFVGGLYLYFRFQDLVPLTGRRRWLATDPDYEKKIGDDVSRVKQGHHQAKEKVMGRLLNAKIDDDISFESFLSSKLLFLANNNSWWCW